MSVCERTTPPMTEPCLQVYLLGSVSYDAALALQRRLVYQVSGAPDSAALILCEHPPMITVGRQGSRAHISYEPDDLRSRRWPVRWVNRGGGAWLHLPGQFAIYPVLALNHLRIGLQEYMERLQGVLAASLRDFTVPAEAPPGQVGVWVNRRPVAAIGVAVRGWVAYHGAIMNVNADLEPFRHVRCMPASDAIMTSLERERRGPLRVAMVRERIVEYFAQRFAFERTSLFFDHPTLARKAPTDALASHS